MKLDQQGRAAKGRSALWAEKVELAALAIQDHQGLRREELLELFYGAGPGYLHTLGDSIDSGGLTRQLLPVFVDIEGVHVSIGEPTGETHSVVARHNQR